MLEGEIVTTKTVEERREEDIMKMVGPDYKQEMAFWGWYLDPTSPTLMDPKESALKAGFSEEKARVIREYQWFKRGTLKTEVFNSAEGVLKEMLNLSTVGTKTLKDGSTVTIEDSALIKIKQDTAKFIASTLGKRDYSQRTEISGKDGGAIETKVVKIDDREFENILNAYAERRTKKQPAKDSNIEKNI